MKTSKGRVSLERALSKLGLCSRNEATELIRSGQVKVHGTLENNPSRMVNPDTAHIEVNAQKAKRSETVVMVFYKPKGVVTTKRDPEERKTIYDLLPKEHHSLHAVGRLDMHTTGLLLLTNDTKLSHYLTEPSSSVERIYLVTVKGKVAENFTELLCEGVSDRDEILKADQAKVLKVSGRESFLELTLTAGKNREIRRLCLALGHEVTALKRIRYDQHELLDLKPGEFRFDKRG